MLKSHKEIERKFILKRLPKGIKQNKKYKKLAITQYYFFIDGKWQRFRCVDDKKTKKYIHTIKSKIQPGVNNEAEGRISAKKFNKILSDNKKAGGKLIEKDRYVVKYKKLKFEIDAYKKVHLITLEVELPDLSFPIDFPAELSGLIVADVTNVKGFSNLSLSEPI